MRIISLFVALLVCQPSLAADVLLQEQNELWLAQQAAQNILLSGDCAKTTIVRMQKFKLFDRDGNIYINGADYLIRCTEKKPEVVTPGPNDAALSWDMPSTRTDGRPFAADELQGYYLYHNDQQIKLGKVNSLVIPDLPAGVHEFYIQAIDTDGLVSENSNKVQKEL